MISKKPQGLLSRDLVWMKGLENGQLFCLYHQGVSLEAFVKNAKNSLTYLKVETRAIQAFLKFFVPVQNEKNT